MPNISDIAQKTGLPSYEDYLKESQKARQPVQNLGKNEFLQLLTAQLAAQDPMEPAKDTDFIAQLAQFSSLEMMEQMSSSMAASQYYNLAGKYVAVDIQQKDGTSVTEYGSVARIYQKDGEFWAQITTDQYVYDIKASKISQVLDKDLFDQKNPLLDNAHLIGRSVKALVADENAEGKTREVEGTVTRIAVENYTIVAYVQNPETGVSEKVLVSGIYDIKDQSYVQAPAEASAAAAVADHGAEKSPDLAEPDLTPAPQTTITEDDAL